LAGLPQQRSEAQLLTGRKQIPAAVAQVEEAAEVEAEVEVQLASEDRS
jgi:hypothetical protein